MTISSQMLRSMGDELAKISGVRTGIHEGIRNWGQGMEARGNRVVQHLAGRKKQLVEDTAGEAVEGAKKKIMTMGGSPNTQMRQFGREMGEEAAEGVLKKIRPTGKMMAIGGAGALAAGGLAAYGAHRLRKRRDAQIQQAVASGIRQGRG